MRSALILVVEDHPINRRMLQAQLAAECWQSELVATGAEALLWLTHTRPVAVITDYVLEDMTGVELLHRVRRWEADAPGFPPIPMILYSGMSLEYLQNESRGLDCTAVLTKPISRLQLRQTLAPFLTQAATSESSASALSDSGDSADDLLAELLQFGYQQLICLKLSIKNQQMSETASIAHGLRGAAAVLRQTEISQSAAEIENQSRNNASETLDEACTRLQHALERLALQIKTPRSVMATSTTSR
ncbi:sensory box histidine kinase/response regulator [Collimonas arenae]|uniref:Sensory box histidine kinase/response regulator n=1 Tax=Collimonas arenae TaxID=279058 RepID=A0A0A1F973_9BURK|nr:response regulator [Collimonas arenae]AIY40310.1 sensory box histidine kinase/response regulator [Collimonas arenae]